MTRVAIVLINYKDYAKKFLPDCIESLRKVTFPDGEFKFFIVDNETSAESRAYLKQVAPEAELIVNEKNLGFGGGNNTGIKRALSQGFNYFYLLNMDTEVEPDFLTQAMKVYKSDSRIGLVQSRLMLFDEPTKINSLGNNLHFLGFGFCDKYKDEFERSSYQNKKKIIYPSGAALLISQDVLEKIGFFTEEFFMYHDDVEWGWKARLQGYENVLALDSVVYHKYEFSRSIKKYYWMERNRFLCCLMCYHWLTLLILFPAWLVMELGMVVFGLKNKWLSEKLKAYLWIFHLKNFKKTLKWRKAVQARRVKKDAQIVKDFVGKIGYQEAEMDNWLLTRVANPMFGLYWRVCKKIIIW